MDEGLEQRGLGGGEVGRESEEGLASGRAAVAGEVGGAEGAGGEVEGELGEALGGGGVDEREGLGPGVGPAPVQGVGEVDLLEPVAEPPEEPVEGPGRTRRVEGAVEGAEDAAGEDKVEVRPGRFVGERERGRKQRAGGGGDRAVAGVFEVEVPVQILRETR